MKRSVRPTIKRELFTELTEGMDALADARHGKRLLRTHSMEFKPAPIVSPPELIRVRKNPKLMKGNGLLKQGRWKATTDYPDQTEFL